MTVELKDLKTVETVYEVENNGWTYRLVCSDDGIKLSRNGYQRNPSYWDYDDKKFRYNVSYQINITLRDAIDIINTEPAPKF